MSRFDIRFTAYGEPKGQPRPRAFARRMGNKYVARVFDAGTAEGWKSAVALAAKPFAPAAPLTGPVQVDLGFFFARPKSHHKGNDRQRELREDAPHFHRSKPDIDNLAKAVLDALTQLGAFWQDDSQVCRIYAHKFYSDRSGCTIGVVEAIDTQD